MCGLSCESAAMKNKAWIEGVAVALMGCLLLPFLWQIAPLRYVLLCVVVVGLIGAGALAVRERGRLDPYDLEALRKVHEREEIQRLLDEEQLPDNDVAVCPHCGSAYNEKLGSCPNCRCN